MRKHLLLFTAAGLLSLSGCEKAEKKNNSAPSENSSTISSKPITIEFTGTENFTIKNPKVKVSLYGISEGLQDAPATLITEKEFEQKSVPFTIELPVPEDAESKIDPKPTHGAKYYVSMEWDSDGNGKANDKGDVFIDYDKEFPNVKLSSETVQKVYLKILK